MTGKSISGAASAAVVKATGANEGVLNYGIAGDFPSLWAISKDVDDIERVGGQPTVLGKEIAAALRELWNARREAERNKMGNTPLRCTNADCATISFGRGYKKCPGCGSVPLDTEAVQADSEGVV